MGSFKGVIVLFFVNSVTGYVNTNQDSTLKLVHVIFRHGDRTTDAKALYPKDPYINETYYPYGLGELTNQGKRKVYELGKRLRMRYDKFLGEIYIPDVLEAWSSDMSRTKASLELVLAGLFPPVHELIWKIGLNWQPIPFKTLPIDQDLLFFSIAHPIYINEYTKVINSPKVRKECKRNTELFNYLSKHTGKDFKSFWDLSFLYDCLSTEEKFGLTLPEWTKNVYPQPLKNLALKSYEINTFTSKLRMLTAGYMLKKIVDDSLAKISNKLSPPTRKIFLYSGHEINIAHILLTLDVPLLDIPPYGSHILFELHNINNIDGFKIFYQDYNSIEPRLIKLPACDEFCPLNQFVSLIQEYFPK